MMLLSCSLYSRVKSARKVTLSGKEVLMRRNQTPDLTESFLQHGIWWYQYHQRFKWQCVSALVISRSVHPGQRTKHKRVNNVTEEIFNM